MKFKITRTSGPFGEDKPCDDIVESKHGDGWIKEFCTLDGLIDFAKLHGCIILHLNKCYPEIEIYDDYRE